MCCNGAGDGEALMVTVVNPGWPLGPHDSLNSIALGMRGYGIQHEFKSDQSLGIEWTGLQLGVSCLPFMLVQL